MSAFAWSVVHAVEVHLVFALLLVGGHHARPRAEPVAPVEVTLDEVEDAAKAEPIARAAVRSPSVGRPGQGRPHRGSPPASAASAIALPDVGDPLPVAWAPAYPGGLTSSLGTSKEPGDELGTGGAGGMPGDMSAPAHLDGRRNWTCTVEGAPGDTIVRARALVRPDGSAVRVEVLDQGNVPDLVLGAAAPCALRERYIAGRDHDGQPVQRWTRPFRIVVVGL